MHILAVHFLKCWEDFVMGLKSGLRRQSIFWKSRIRSWITLLFSISLTDLWYLMWIYDQLTAREQKLCHKKRKREYCSKLAVFSEDSQHSMTDFHLYSVPLMSSPKIWFHLNVGNHCRSKPCWPLTDSFRYLLLVLVAKYSWALPQSWSPEAELSHPLHTIQHCCRLQKPTHAHGLAAWGTWDFLIVLEDLSDTVQSYWNLCSHGQRCDSPGHTLEVLLSLGEELGVFVAELAEHFQS